MIKESGRIIEIKEVDGAKIAVVECVSKSACKSCSSNDNCGVGVVAKGLSDKSHHLTFPFEDGMKINETIDLFIENKEIVKSSLIIYIIPLLSFVLGALLSLLITENEPIVIAVSLLSLLLGAYLAKKTSEKYYPDDVSNSLIRTK